MVSKAQKAPADRPSTAPQPPARPEPVPWRATRVSKTLWPPQAGTKRLIDRYGEAVVCVRYRHDPAARMRYTTVEMVVDCGPVRTPRQAKFACELDATLEMGLKVTARALTDAGARWDEAAQVWRLTEAMARGLGLEAQLRRPGRGRRSGR